jgi:protein gp37
MRKTKIDWCDYTINPVIGCTFGCEYCYAKKLNDRFHFVEDFSKPQFREQQLDKIYKIKNSNIFMNSMSDIADWSIDTVLAVLNIAYANQSNNYLFLTKRPLEICPKSLNNCWYGVTITNGNEAIRSRELIKAFEESPDPVNLFLSIEPILDSVFSYQMDLARNKIKWLIIGAETGNRKNKVIPKKEWITYLVNQCRCWNIPVFMKSSLKKIMGDDFIQEWPKEMRQ